MTLLENCIREDFGLIQGDSRYARSVEHTSLVYDRVDDKFYWNSIGLFGNLIDYLTKVRNMDTREVYVFVRHNKDSTPLDEILSDREEPVQLAGLVESFYNLGKKHREYWYDVRGYTDETIDNFMLGFTGYWYCIPVFVDGVMKNFQLRLDNPKRVSQWYKGVGLLPFNFSILNFTDWVVITEGPPDAIMLRQNGIPAISQNGGSSSWDIAWNPRLMRLKNIYIVYDNDEAGNNGALKVAKNFGYKARIFNFFDFPARYDITDYFKAGGGKDDFMNYLLTESVTYDKLQGKDEKDVYNRNRR